MPMRWHAGASARAPQHQAVVAGLLDPAQVERVAVLLGDDQADDLGVEQPAGFQVLDREHDMAGARDVERRVVVGLGQVHCVLWRMQDAMLAVRGPFVRMIFSLTGIAHLERHKSASGSHYRGGWPVVIRRRHGR